MRKQLFSVLRKIKEILSNKFRQYDHKLPYIITTLITAIIVIGGIKLFIELTEFLKSDVLANYDTAVTNFFIDFRSPAITTVFTFITNFGDTLGYVIMFSLSAIFFYWILKSWKYVAQIALVMILALGSNLLLKKTIDRARPVSEHLVEVETLSFPSGHATMAMAFYGFIIYLIFSLPINKFIKFFLITIFAFLILGIGLSRIYLGVHYPSDVFGGFIAGFIWVVFCVMIFNLIKIFRRDPET